MITITVTATELSITTYITHIAISIIVSTASSWCEMSQF